MNVKEALAPFAAIAAERYEARIRYSFEQIVKKFGPTCRGAANDWTWARTWCNSVRAHTKTIVAEGARPTMNDPYEIDEKNLKKAAVEFGKATVEAWEVKIVAKLVDIADVQVNQFGGCRFDIVGTRNGRTIRIEQDMIVNVSKLGTLFNQFPSRIYVDGKFYSEANYKKLFA